MRRSKERDRWAKVCSSIHFVQSSEDSLGALGSNDWRHTVQELPLDHAGQIRPRGFVGTTPDLPPPSVLQSNLKNRLEFPEGLPGADLDKSCYPLDLPILQGLWRKIRRTAVTSD
jgi:hypothetical protein